MHRATHLRLRRLGGTMSPRTWLEQAITAAAPAIMRGFERQLANPVDAYLGVTVPPAVDPTREAFTIIDNSLRRRADTPADRRGPGWQRAVDIALDCRLNLMADRDRGFRIVGHRRTR